MLSTHILTILALLATSASALSMGGPSGPHQRRHAHKAVVGVRSPHGSEGARTHLVAKRDVLPPRKRGINARRVEIKPKNTSALPTSSTPSTTSADPTPTDSDPDPEPTTTSAKPTKTRAATTSTPDKPTKTSSTAEETPTDDGGSSSGGSGQYSGDATFYGTGLGACGFPNKDTDFIAAASKLLFDGFEGYTGGNPNNNPICNKKVKAFYQGKSVTVTITDRCEACSKFALDFSPSAFSQLADQSIGRLHGMTWSFI
ncbi:hypothetical protein RhiJN_04360 [Ceratobasidium sp. AG-Ba]|nr:hypothetical protein RhiJN_04360 [Ceratobasidium sp. AG-Ba]QRW05249.1 hypothetical protein RhiLY_04248 [Ceratobasidium sp. AG-Ba]